MRKRPLPPVAGEERQQFIAQAQADFQDFAMIGDATTSVWLPGGATHEIPWGATNLADRWLGETDPPRPSAR